MNKYIENIIARAPGVIELLNIWAGDSSPFNSFNYPQNNSLSAKYDIINSSSQSANIHQLFQILQHGFQINPAWNYQRFRVSLTRRYPPSKVNTNNKYHIVTMFLCIRNWLNNIILGAPRFNFPLYLFRLTKSAGQQYEFVENKTEDKFTSYTMFPFGWSSHQDIVSVKHFSDTDCCFSIASLPANTPCLYIPNEIIFHLVDEIVTPLNTQKINLKQFGIQTYTYTPVVSVLEATTGYNLISTITKQEGKPRENRRYETDSGGLISLIFFKKSPVTAI